MLIEVVTVMNTDLWESVGQIFFRSALAAGSLQVINPPRVRLLLVCPGKHSKGGLQPKEHLM